MAYTRELNALARSLLGQRGELGRSEKIATEQGVKEFAVHDRIYFLRNEKTLGVKNGFLGTIEAIRDNIVQVRLDGREQRVAVDTRFYKDLDYGYAATVYKAQGSTVDRSYLLATPHYDRHATYVALSRHRESAHVVYAAADFGAVPENAGQRQKIRARLLQALSRARPKELAHDYLERAADVTGASVPGEDGRVGAVARSERAPEQTSGPTWDQIKQRQQQAAESWAQSQRQRPSLDELRRQGCENWMAQRSERLAQERTAAPEPEVQREPTDRDTPQPTLEELRAQGREAWLRSRQQGPPAPGAQKESRAAAGSRARARGSGARAVIAND